MLLRPHFSAFYACTVALSLSLTPNWGAKADSRSPNSEMAQQDAALRTTLSNGLEVVIVRSSLAPVVQTQMIYNVGSSAAPEGFPGTAHALEHMMFNGSRHLGREQLSIVSAKLGNHNNAFTTEDLTQFYFQADASDLPLLLRIEADRMRSLNLYAADWAHERGAIEQEVMRDLSMPFERYLVRQNAVLFDGTAYSHDALGTRPSFDRTTVALLRAFYHAWYQPNNAILLIVGDVAPQTALDEVKQAFSSIKAHPLPARPKISPHPAKAQTISIASDYATGFITYAFLMPGAASPDYATAQILSDVLASQRGALFALVPQGKALGTEFSYEPRAQWGVGNAIAAYPAGADPSALRKTLHDILVNICQNGVPIDLVNAAKQKEIADLEFAANSLAGLTQTWADALALNKVASPYALVRAFSAVTPTAVNALAKRLLDPDHMITGIITPSEKGAPRGPAPIEKREHLLPPPTRAVSLPNWVQKALNRPISLQKFPQPQQFVFPNGLRLIVKQESVSHTIKLYGVIRHNNGLQEPKGKEGIASLVDQLFLYGSASHDRLNLASALDALAADAEGGISFSASALTPNFAQTLALLADNELHPAFPQAAFTTLKAQAIATRAGVLKSPEHLFKRAVLTSLNPPGDPSLRQATPASLRAIQYDDIKTYYAQTYRPDLTTIVLIGDINSQKAKQLIGASFGNWKVLKPTPRIDLPARPNSTSSVKTIVDPGRQQDQVWLAETIAQGIHNPDRYALEVGNYILGSGFNSRLMQALRVQTGMVYSTQSLLQWSRNRAAFVVVYGSDPDRTRNATSAAISQVHNLTDAPVDNVSLENAKTEILRAMPLERASFDQLADIYLRLIDLGLPLTTPDDKARLISQMTSAQILKAFQTWVRPNSFAHITLAPKFSSPK